VISTVSLPSRRAGVTPRLVHGFAADLAAYRAARLADLRALAVDSTAWYLAVAVLVSQLADAVSTMVALANNAAEGNLLTATVIERWGLPGLLFEKTVITGVVIWNMARLRGRGAWALGLVAGLVGFAAAGWNLHLLLGW
jgi:hypothetical protein